ncbi:hypothetical protein U9M48_026005 [Paspalum notatum var. saurae]|uniref:Uncharacterized protein n=1 Tax=Paspalum notatum var. saurae TaxID=547442 RepID=A0AAQ3TTS1_PASNO
MAHWTERRRDQRPRLDFVEAKQPPHPHPTPRIALLHRPRPPFAPRTTTRRKPKPRPDPSAACTRVTAPFTTPLLPQAGRQAVGTAKEPYELVGWGFTPILVLLRWVRACSATTLAQD